VLFAFLLHAGCILGWRRLVFAVFWDSRYLHAVMSWTERLRLPYLANGYALHAELRIKLYFTEHDWLYLCLLVLAPHKVNCQREIVRLMKVFFFHVVALLTSIRGQGNNAGSKKSNSKKHLGHRPSFSKLAMTFRCCREQHPTNARTDEVPPDCGTNA